MIEQLTGRIERKNKGSLIINVNGISYNIKASANCINNIELVGEKTCILTYLHVRENLLDLYGFKSQSERKSFFLLISISGIGPKLAITILSGLKFGDLKDYVIEEDVKSLTSVPGVGAKTAKRIIIELKEKFLNLIDNDLEINEDLNKKTVLFNNVVSALVNLGYKKNQAIKVCNKLVNDGEFKGDVEFLIKKTLSSLIS